MKILIIYLIIWFNLIYNCFSIPFRVMPLSYTSKIIPNNGFEIEITTTFDNRFIFNVDNCDIKVNYGDGSISNYNSSGYKIHTYTENNTYTSYISGAVSGKIEFGYYSDYYEHFNITKVLLLGNGIIGLTDASYMFNDCESISTFSDNLFLNQTNITNLDSTWADCISSTNFPLVNQLVNVTNLNRTWYGCEENRRFPDVYNLTNVTSLISTWRLCLKARQLPEINALTNVTSLENTWCYCEKITNFPSISNLIKTTNLYATWRLCKSATNFPSISNLTNVTTLLETWRGCTNARTFPEFFSNNIALTNVSHTFYNCNNISGTAPQLWNTILFPNITVYTNCFKGMDPVKISNWDSIPVGWK